MNIITDEKGVVGLEREQERDEMRERIRRLELELKASKTRRKSDVEALVKRINVQKVNLRTLKNKVLDQKKEIDSMSLENENLKSEKRMNVGRTGHSDHFDNQTDESGMKAKEEVTSLKLEIHNVKAKLQLALQDRKHFEKKLERANDTIATLRHQHMGSEGVNARLRSLEVENKKLTLRVKDVEHTENLLEVYRAEVERSVEMKKVARKLEQENFTLKANQENLIKLQKKVEQYGRREAEWETAIEEKERKEHEAMYYQEQANAWKNAITRFYPHALSPAVARDTLGEANQRELSLKLKYNSVQLKEKEASMKLKSLADANEKLSQEVSRLQDQSKLTETRLQECKVKLKEVARERSSLKEMLNHYDLEDLKENKIKDKKRVERIEILENSLSKLEKQNEELTHFKERFDQAQSDMKLLKTQHSRLEKMLDRKEQEIATLHAKLGRGDYNKTTTKVLHFKMNPQKQAGVKRKMREKAVLEEKIEELEAKLNAYEEAVATGKGIQANDTKSLERIAENVRRRAEAEASMLLREREMKTELEMWKGEAERMRGDVMEGAKRLNRLKEVFKVKVSEFREACYRMTGYKIELVDGDKYRLRPMYAGSEKDEVLIQFHHGQLSVLATEFVQRLDKSVSGLLTEFHSVPAFLAQITLDLFNQTTMQTVTAAR